MSENYITVAFPENIKLATGFKNECLSLQKSINSINASELECCYHLFKLKAYNESISLMGCKSLEDFAERYFGFKGSTVRNYVRIGALCEVKKIGNKNKVVSCYADENGNDFTRSQLNELLSISDNKEVGFAVATPEQRANPTS